MSKFKPGDKVRVKYEALREEQVFFNLPALLGRREATLLGIFTVHEVFPAKDGFRYPADECISLKELIGVLPEHKRYAAHYEKIVEDGPLYDLKPNSAQAKVASKVGMKFDGDKPRADLLVFGMPNALEGVAAVLTFGAKKYAAHSWQAVPDNIARYNAAMTRHMLAIAKGEINDPESGLPHIDHVACNALFLAELHRIGGTPPTTADE